MKLISQHNGKDVKKILLIGVSILSAVFGYSVTRSRNKSPQPTQKAESQKNETEREEIEKHTQPDQKDQETDAVSIETLENLGYHELRFEELDTVENVDYLVTDKNIASSKDALTIGMNSIRRYRCSKPCNVSFWDNEEAFNLDKNKYEKELTEEQDIFVAEHIIGFSPFDPPDLLMEYPFKSP